jgi:hypothetical protein
MTTIINAVAPATLSLPVGPVLAASAAAPVALRFVDADPLVQVITPAAPAAASAESHAERAAMRPDQLFMARQLAWPVQDGATLASSWRTMVKTYGSQLLQREQQARSERLPAALLMAGQEPRAQGQLGAQGELPPDAWRFTLQTGAGCAQQLRVLADGPDQPPGRRRRPRAALRLELTLADGTRVTVQAEPQPGGVVLELCTEDASALAMLKQLQPALEAALERAGVPVLRWKFRASLPAGTAHASMAATDAATALTLPVFRAMAEMALLLPAQRKLAG